MTYHSPNPNSAPCRPPVPAQVSITLRLADCGSDVLTRHVRLLRDCVALAQQRWGFTIEAAVVLPAEMQMICAFDDSTFGVSGAVTLIRSAFDRHLPSADGSVWAKKFETLILSPAAAASRRAFVEHAPVRAGLVTRAEDWPFSSVHRDAAQSADLGVDVA